jgi:hypothetical protein
MAEEAHRENSPSPNQQTSTSQLLSHNEKKDHSFAKSFRASIQKVSNLYGQTSKIFSRMGDASDLEEDEKLFVDDGKNLKEKSKSLLSGG